MAIKAGVVVSYRIVFGSRVIGRGLVIDPLKFGFVIELHDSEPHADPWQKSCWIALGMLPVTDPTQSHDLDDPPETTSPCPPNN